MDLIIREVNEGFSLKAMSDKGKSVIGFVSDYNDSNKTIVKDLDYVLRSIKFLHKDGVFNYELKEISEYR